MPNKILGNELRNYEVDILALAAQGAGTVQSVDFDNQTGIGIQLFINLTAVTGSVVVTLLGKDPVSGVYYTILASAALAAAALTRLTVYPNAPNTANVSVNDLVPKTWAVKATVTGGPVTGTVGAFVACGGPG